jgi:two-component system, NtrC family, response regulator HydG
MQNLPLILYIDGNMDSCEILEILMRRQGFEVISRQSAAEALNDARKKSFTAVVSEYVLSDIDAIELCSELKKINPETPIVFYTTEARNEHKQRGLLAGAKAFLVKPNDLESIEKIIADIALSE